MIDREAVWADLKCILDELDRPPLGNYNRLVDVPNLTVQSEDKLQSSFPRFVMLDMAYSRAIARANVKNAHEAIEKGLKAILIDSGWTRDQVTSRGHQLHILLRDVQQHNPEAFDELERCFDSAIQYLEFVSSAQSITDMVDYFRENGRHKVFIDYRYASIEGVIETGGGVILRIHCEIIRALLSIMLGWTPNDINSRIEEEVRNTILEKSKLDPAWGAEEWLNLGPARPRLEAVESLKYSKVLRAAVRRCAKKSEDEAIQFWAKRLRHKFADARKEASNITGKEK